MYNNIEEYKIDKARLNSLINEATAKGMLEPDMDNEYTREIGIIGNKMAEYEDAVLKVMNCEKNPASGYNKVSYRVSMPVFLHETVAKKASQLGQSISEYVSSIMARELNVAL